MTNETEVLILEKLANHDEQLEFIRENMVLREEFVDFKGEFEDLRGNFHSFRAEMLEFRGEMLEFREEMFQRQDDMMVILLRLDQERLFTNERITRIEEKIK